MLLTELLRALAEPTPRSLPDIAASLGTTTERVGIALEQCERLGYLDRGEDPCTVTACGSCVIACGMRPGDPRGQLGFQPRWWRLTERGRRAAALGGRAAALGGRAAALGGRAASLDRSA